MLLDNPNVYGITENQIMDKLAEDFVKLKVPDNSHLKGEFNDLCKRLEEYKNGK